MWCLVEDDDGTMRLKCHFDLLRVFLWYTLFEYLWQRFDKLFRLDPTYSAKKNGAKNCQTRMTDLNEGEVRHESLDLLDDLRLGTRVERFEPHVKYRLFFWLGGNLFACRCFVCGGTCCGRNGCARCGEGNFLDVQTRL
jgi:hypothetical protein